MTIQLPYPYTPGLPGSGLGDPAEYADSVQANFDALAIATGQVTQYAPWIAVSAFTNSWANFGSGFSNASYYKDALGQVHLKGLVKSGTIGAVAMFTLPPGFRPLEHQYFPVTANNAFGFCSVQSTGDVQAVVGSNVSFSLANIHYRAEA